MNRNTNQTVNINGRIYNTTVGNVIDELKSWGMDPTVVSHYSDYYGIWAPRARDIVEVVRHGR